MLSHQDSRIRAIALGGVILAVAIGSFLMGTYFGRTGTPGALMGSGNNKTVAGVGSSSPKDVLTNDSIQFNQFWELWKLLKLKYYQDTSEEMMFYGAMQGMADALGDPYTTFFQPVVAKEFSDSLKGEFEGIGAEIGVHSGQLQVIAPLPDTPAEKVGLIAGDYILAINGTSTEGMLTEEAVTLIRGPKGSTVTLKIGRISANNKKQNIKNGTSTSIAGEPIIKDYKITRDKIVVKSVRLSWPKANIALIEVSSFNEDTDVEFRKVVDQTVAKNPKGIILDLRNDPGGYLDRSTVVAGAWVGNQVVVSEKRKEKIVDSFQGTGPAVFKDIPTAVLVNQGTASAAEIVAGALQDYGLGKLIGMKTFGKGSVQDYSEFSDGSAVKITIAEWLTPKGRSINKSGIQPDIEVDKTVEDYDQNRDPQLDKALEWLATE